MSRLSRGLWLLCATAFTLQACGGGGTGPTPAKLANPANTAAQLQSLSAPTATGTFQSFAVLIAHFVAAGSGGLVTAASPVAAAVLGVAIVGTTGPTPMTYANYTISRLVGQSAGASVAGFVSDGVTRLDLTSALTATLTAFTVQTTVDVAAQGVHISETASVSG